MLGVGLSLWQPAINRANGDYTPPEPIAFPLGGTPSLRTLAFATTDYATEHDLYLPADLEAGRTVFLYITIGGLDSFAPPEGWDVVYSLANQMTAVCLKRTLDGTEGTAVHITTPYARKVTWVAMCIEGALGEYDVKTIHNIDHPTLAALPELETRFENNFLWLAGAHWRQGSRTLEAPEFFSEPFFADSGFVGTTEHHTAVAALEMDDTTLWADTWESNQVFPDANQAITSLLAVYPVEDYEGGDPLPSTEYWLKYDGTYVTHLGTPVTYTPVMTMVLDGSSGTYASTPHSEAVDITGDMTLVVKFAADSLSPLDYQRLISRDGNVGRAYMLGLLSSGGLNMQVLPEGSSNWTSVGQVNAASYFQAGRASWLAFSLLADDGDGGRATRIFKSSNGTHWSLIGEASGDAVSIGSTSARLLVGTYSSSAGTFSGTIYRAQVYSGAGFNLSSGPSGTLVADFNPADAGGPMEASDSFESVKTGETWTLHGNAFTKEVLP